MPTKAEQKSIETQTDNFNVEHEELAQLKTIYEKRPLDLCLQIFRENGAQKLEDFLDEEIIEMVNAKHVPIYKLESYFKDATRAVQIRRRIIEAKLPGAKLTDLPYENYNYSKIIGSCCENVIGYVPIPLGVAGPLLIDGKYYHIPMATTEGTLVASTNRGCTALSVNIYFTLNLRKKFFFINTPNLILLLKPGIVI